MSIQVQCMRPECRATFELADTEAGDTILCRKCHAPFQVPIPPTSGLAGQSLGGFKLIRRLAKGGMGEVYEATQLALDRRVALKLLSDDLAQNPMFMQRFEREAKAAAALNHSSVVQVYDFGHAEGRTFLAMEFVEGEDLAKLVARIGKLPAYESLQIVEQIALALQEALSVGIIHRDIKPANILLSAQGKVKLSDLGLAKRIHEDADLTMTGIGFGSPHFISPEQADDARTADHRSDIYSLGITLLFLLTGKRPFDGGTALSIVLAHASKPLPSGLELGTELPENIEQLILQMTAKVPGDRYQDYKTLIEDLRRVQAGQSPIFQPSIPELGSTEQTQALDLMEVRNPSLQPTIAVKASTSSTSLRVSRNTGETMTRPRPAEVPIPTASFQSNAKADPARKVLIALAAVVALLGVAVVYLLTTTHPQDPASDQRNDPPSRPSFEANVRTSPFASPLPPFQPPKPPIANGTVSKMLTELRAYAANNPQSFNSILAGLDKVKANASGSSLESEVDRTIESWRQKKAQAVSAALAQFEGEMHSFFRVRDVPGGRAVWASFPMELRSPDLDRNIEEILEQHTPPPPGRPRDNMRPPPDRHGPPPSGPPPQDGRPRPENGRMRG